MVNTLEDVVRHHVSTFDPTLSLSETMLRLARDVAERARQETQHRFQLFFASESANQLDVAQPASRKSVSKERTTTTQASCPFPGCKGTPIRPQRNFCSEHAKALDEKQKLQLRNQQKLVLKEAKRAAR
jgi:hypothetical protein